MTADLVIQVFRDVLMLAIRLAGPLLVISMVVGLCIAVFQAATQINEQTLTFVPKALTITVLLLLLAPSMISALLTFVESIFELVVRIGQQTTVL